MPLLERLRGTLKSHGKTILSNICGEKPCDLDNDKRKRRW
jgi:hypothetical protein